MKHASLNPILQLILWTSLILSVSGCANKNTEIADVHDNFDWSKATVYFVMTDRFCNGDSTNDINYGRRVDYGSEQMNAATFHGGDWAGMLQKANEGYFSNLGVDVVWITDPYEQIHGWMTGSGEVNDFPHYGYHGYYPLDYTQTDKNYGTVQELHALVDTLHAQGIRVMMGANINDPGYPTLLDALQYKFAPVPVKTEAEATEHIKDWNYSKWYATSESWERWWTNEWLRLGKDCNCNDQLTCTLYGLPDYRSDKTTAVKIPQFLKDKWTAEGSDNDAYTWQAIKELRKDRNAAPLDYVSSWIAAWVEEFGFDGFRCDVVEYTEDWRWRQLYDKCDSALMRWRAAHPDDPASKWTSRMYFTGDHEDAFITYLPEYAKAGFSSMVNMKFPKDGNLNTIVSTWQQYSDSLNAHNDWWPFSYLNNAYFREADPDRAFECATSFVLSPGAVQIFYGDEVGRQMSDAKYNVDAAQAFRSDYDWENRDLSLMEHYSKLCAFRKYHPAVGMGVQKTIDSLTCIRSLDYDTVVIRVLPENNSSINLGGAFADGTEVINAYTGEVCQVSNGTIKLTQPSGSVALISK